MKQQKRIYKGFVATGIVLVCCFLTLAALRLIPADIQAQTITTASMERELDARIETFFTSLSRGTSSTAFEETLRLSTLGTSSADPAIQEMRSRVDSMRSQFGNILHWEKYETKRIGEDVILIRYLLKYDIHPVMWTFSYYRKPTGPSIVNNPWLLVGLHFETDVFQY